MFGSDDRLQARAETFEVFKQVYPRDCRRGRSARGFSRYRTLARPGTSIPKFGLYAETLRAVFEVVPSPNLGICYDPSHFARIGVDYKRVLMEFGSRVRHVHAKDTELLADGLYEFGCLGQSFGQRYGYGEGWWRYCIPGMGCGGLEMGDCALWKNWAMTGRWLLNWKTTAIAAVRKKMQRVFWRRKAISKMFWDESLAFIPIPSKSKPPQMWGLFVF